MDKEKLNQAKKILETVSTPGWMLLENSIVLHMQGKMHLVVQEGDEAIAARSEVRACRDVLNLLASKVGEAKAALQEEAKAQEAVDAQEKEASAS